MTLYLIGKIKALKFKDYLANLGGNWFIPLSAVFFMLTNLGMWNVNLMPFEFDSSIIPSCVLILVLSAVCPSFISFMSHSKIKLRVISLLSSAGICYGIYSALGDVPYTWGGDTFVQRIAFLILGYPFVFAVNLLFWTKFDEILNDILDESGVKKAEWIIYSVLFLILCAYAAFCFLSSQAFYGTSHDIDIIYSSDSPGLVKHNAFVCLDNVENDVRQPLFAAASAPLMGISCLIGYLIPVVPAALIIDFAQIFLLLFSALILSFELKLSSLQRICFVLTASATFTFLLFSIMMEQYIIAFFWLVLTFRYMNRDRKEAVLLTFASSGTLLISGILVPFVMKPEKKGIDLVFEWIKSLLIYCLDFLLILILAGRTNIILNTIDNLAVLSLFTGKSIGYSERFLQYLNFVGGCFIAPASEEIMVEGLYFGWHLSEVTSVNYIGVAVIALSVLAFIITRKSKISRIALGWICLSMFVLIVIGWGIYENGLILYALYFGWPFYVLIFNLLKSAEDRLKTKIIIPLTSAVMVIVFLIFNIPELARLISFAISRYPFG
ncbi:MAG: hypothetical protein K5665_08925 [Saccharofermentans sp.]|nr:hypothetical protein [Saccharofermentans sp.]